MKEYSIDNYYDNLKLSLIDSEKKIKIIFQIIEECF